MVLKKKLKAGKRERKGRGCGFGEGLKEMMWGNHQ